MGKGVGFSGGGDTFVWIDTAGQESRFSGEGRDTTRVIDEVLDTFPDTVDIACFAAGFEKDTFRRNQRSRFDKTVDI